MSPALDSSLASLEEHVGTIEEVGINALNDDCLTFIMQYLPIVDRVRMERVCKRWQAVSLNAWHNFKKLNFNNKYWGFSAPFTLAEVNHRIIEKVLKRCGEYLISIEFNSKFNERLDQNVVSSVARFCPNVQHLDVWRLKISLRSWSALYENCSKLVSFAVSDCTDCELSLLFEKNRELKRLYVFSSNVTGEFLNNLYCYSIESIVFVHCPMITLGNFHVIRDFCETEPLVLEENFSLDEGFMKDISSYRKSVLKYLTLAYGYANSLVAIGTNRKPLKKVTCYQSLLVLYLKNINDHALQETDCRDLMNMRNTGVVKLIEESQTLERLLGGLRDYIEKAARGGHKSDEETFDY
ncbi:uncharacterized protein LOC100679720 isoform X2 [Nasonia vitripennis]|nr:uncharacterized protein LOC100679720 isoform X2 [Nasonia vitripennis]XP_031780768.1 uncharacterized protein LOC100679720 isoform X2 [Nasonia vitripennis]XP_031780769.1 uncharacterized protein LOC100679720 isoform X2 [Nasonia vitripennis]